MSGPMFRQLETAAAGTSVALADAIAALRFNADGLLPAIAQQHDSGEVLMLAWMSREALAETLATGRVCYWSRSRQALWRKGETSGQVQRLVSLAIDCDGDTLLLKVDQQGPACHTGRRDCFYNKVHGNQVTVGSDPLVSPQELYGQRSETKKK